MLELIGLTLRNPCINEIYVQFSIKELESNRSKKFQSPKVRTWTFFGFEVNVIETVIESDPKWTAQKGESERSLK